MRSEWVAIKPLRVSLLGKQHMNTIKLSNDSEVKYVRGMRFADFLKHNGTSDADTAKLWYDEAKAISAAELSDEIAKRQLSATSSKLDIVHRGGAFFVRPTITYKEYDANEEHTELVTQWAQQKRKMADAAMEKARIFKAGFKVKP
jgi:hypothetical protein